MRFHEKLDFLMNITATTNVLISRKINMDPSYISRLRRGERKPIRDRFVVETMSTHFVRNAILDYQVELLNDMIYPDYKERDERGRIILLTDWLCDKGIAIRDEIDGITEKNIQPLTKGKSAKDTITQNSSGIYYGFEGKKQATLRFLATIMKSKETNPILFFDDGDSSWLVEDVEFKQKVRKGLQAAIEKGHSIKIIHNTKRPLNDMIKAIELWVPVHFTGMVEAYYYPKVRDDLFKRTLCVVPGTVAMVSNAIEEENTVNFLVLDSVAIKSFEDEFLQLIKRCMPLFEVYRSLDRRKFFSLMEEYDSIRGDTIYNLESISLMTMPEEVRDQIMARSGRTNEAFAETHKRRQKIFKEKLVEEKYYEIISLKDPLYISSGKVQFSHSNLSHGYPIYYTRDEYVAHLKNFITLAEENKNFHFVLDEKEKGAGLPLYLKEGIGAVLVSPGGSSTIIHTKENSLTAAFFDFVKHTTALGRYCDEDKDKQIMEMKSYIDIIKRTR